VLLALLAQHHQLPVPPAPAGSYRPSGIHWLTGLARVIMLPMHTGRQLVLQRHLCSSSVVG
jgi:hypothetical protein